MRWLFWLSLLGACYSYCLYPLLLRLLPVKPLRQAPGYRPRRVSIVITARNEAERIADKIRNTLAIPAIGYEREIIVASDASDDGTDALVDGFSEHGVRLMRAETRRGKEYAQHLAVGAASGEVILFTDVATAIPPESMECLLQDFADPSVGAVSSEDRLVAPDGTPVGEGAYVRYEMWLRRLESRVNSLVGLSGSFFAVRTSLCAGWDTGVPSDFNAALNAVRHGLRAVSDPRVVGVYTATPDSGREYRRKWRTVIRGIAGLVRRREMLNPLRYPLFSFQLISHKAMRWLVPWFLLALAVSSVRLAGEGSVYQAVLAAEVGFYLTVLLAYLFPRLQRFAPLRIPYFFAQANLAIGHATLAYLGGTRVNLWDPTRR